jgi:MFS family permease
MTENAGRLLWAGSLGIFAASTGFAIRGGILDNWGVEFGFNAAQLGAISGAGFSGFCFGIVIGGLICDKVGYGKLIGLAFLLHILSAVVTFTAGDPHAYAQLFWGMLIFGYANGTLEAVANPLVATLFPKDRTHYLNLLHASWPAGLVVGGALGWMMDDRLQWDWRIQLTCYLVPTLIYGGLFLGQKMPKSEASQKGLKLSEMLKDVGILGGLVVCYLVALFGHNALGLPAPLAYGVAGILLLTIAALTRFALGSLLLFILFVTHALIGAVELGTDGWIQNITGNILTSEQGKILFVLSATTMFVLRFCAGFIEHRLGLSPIGILLVCSILACIGLNLASAMVTFGGALLALLAYSVGKAFFWPTMLAVVSDRFPRTGAIAISIIGGIGMMSAGLIGTPGLGYLKDRFAGESLNRSAPAVFQQYKSASPSHFLFFEEAHGLDGTRLGQVQSDLARARASAARAGERDPQAALAKLTSAERAVYEANIAGDRKTLKVDALIPASMAAIYFLLFIYFKLTGGYRRVEVGASP